MFDKELDLGSLVNLEDWQRAQDTLSASLEITLQTVSKNGETVGKISRPSRICTEKICNQCLPSVMGVKEKTSVKCPFGLEIHIIPVQIISNKIGAYLIAGPVIPRARKSEAEYANDAKDAGVNFDKLMDALIEINVYSYNKIYAILKTIEEFFTYIAQTSYHKRRLGEIAPEIIEMDPLFSRYYEEKILSSLLNSCTMALDADSGSVMIVDKNTNMLHIKASTKLDSEIVGKAEVRVGEGIAGLAAAKSESIVLPKDKDKLSDTMKRQYIKSSLIMPFNKGNSHDVYGVINLNVVRKEKEFSDRDIALVKELVRMASIALIPIKQSSTDPNFAK